MIWVSAVGGPKQIVGNQQLAFAHSIPGSYLKLTETGELKLIMDHTGVGAAEHIHEWTMRYDDKRFVLVGYAYEFKDLLDSRRRGKCDLDLVDGSGVANDENVSFPPVVKDVNLVDIDFQPMPCKFKFNR